MGLRVEKALVKKKCTKAADGAKAEENTTTKVMFDLQKVNMEEMITPSNSLVEEAAVEEVVEELEEDNATGGCSPVNFSNIEAKTRVTFDEILTSLQVQEPQAEVETPAASSEDELRDI